MWVGVCINLRSRDSDGAVCLFVCMCVSEWACEWVSVCVCVLAKRECVIESRHLSVFLMCLPSNVFFSKGFTQQSIEKWKKRELTSDWCEILCVCVCVCSWWQWTQCVRPQRLCWRTWPMLWSCSCWIPGWRKGRTAPRSSARCMYSLPSCCRRQTRPTSSGLHVPFSCLSSASNNNLDS